VNVLFVLFATEGWAWQTREETGGTEGKDKCGGDFRSKKQCNVANKTVIAA